MWTTHKRGGHHASREIRIRFLQFSIELYSLHFTNITTGWPIYISLQLWLYQFYRSFFLHWFHTFNSISNFIIRDLFQRQEQGKIFQNKINSNVKFSSIWEILSISSDLYLWFKHLLSPPHCDIDDIIIISIINIDY